MRLDQLIQVAQEEYVRRNASAEDLRSIRENPRLIEAAGEQLRISPDIGFLSTVGSGSDGGSLEAFVQLVSTSPVSILPSARATAVR